MLEGGNGDGCGMKLQIARDQLFDGGEDRDRVFGFSFRSSGWVRLYRRDKGDALTG